MSRLWNELVDRLTNALPGGVPMLAFLSLVATILIALAAYFWPSWLPWNWGLRWRRGRSSTGHTARRRRRLRLGALRWRWRLSWRRRARKGHLIEGLAADEPPELPADELPDLPAAAMHLTADQLAAAGRYRESVRERLRAILRELTERGVLPISPGWTLTELARYAARSRPDLAPPLRMGIDVFSEIWYGLRPALAEDDGRLRAAADEVTRHLATVPAGSGGSGGSDGSIEPGGSAGSGVSAGTGGLR